MDSDSNNTSYREDNEVSEQNENETVLSDRELIRKELSTMSFEDLQKLKQKIGSKQYNKMLFGNEPRKRVPAAFKRENKNRPREMSSKKPVQHVQTEQAKKIVSRDPRFDPLCGTFDDKTFKSNYRFVKNIRKKERMQLEKEYKNETDPKKQKKIKLLMQRMDNQIREQEKQEKLNHEKEEEHKIIRNKLIKGEKPVFKKKSEKRIEGLINKYEELKKSNKLQKHFERRYKKLAHQDRKNFEAHM